MESVRFSEGKYSFANGVLPYLPDLMGKAMFYANKQEILRKKYYNPIRLMGYVKNSVNKEYVIEVKHCKNSSHAAEELLIIFTVL